MKAFITALLAAVTLTGCAGGTPDGNATVKVNGESGWKGTAISKGYPLPDQPFTDTAGHTVVPATEAADGVTLVFFGYTHCPDICNVVLANLAQALRGSTDAVRDDTRVLFVTTDPARDTPEVMREYLDRFDERFQGLTAPVGTVEKAAKALHVSFERPDGTTGGYVVDHGTYTTGFVDGDASVVWSDTTTVADLRADLSRLARLA